jgi:FMN-dependent NADH-azoreductase
MSKVLYIKANTTPGDSSRTFKISNSFIDVYRQKNPDDEIITVDLYKEGISLPTLKDVQSIMGAKNEESRNNSSLKYAYQFAEADKYVIAEPMWTLSIPAMLKTYIDFVSVSDITFKYTKQGVVGLLQGKKAVNIITRGGDFSREPLASMLMDDKYLRAIFTFFGITDFTTISANRLDIMGENVELIMQKAMQEAKEIAMNF